MAGALHITVQELIKDLRPTVGWVMSLPSGSPGEGRTASRYVTVGTKLGEINRRKQATGIYIRLFYVPNAPPDYQIPYQKKIYLPKLDMVYVEPQTEWVGQGAWDKIQPENSITWARPDEATNSWTRLMKREALKESLSFKRLFRRRGVEK